jgi:hypothetical protein
MAARRIRLRYATSCARCSTTLEARTSAWWDNETKRARCETCASATTPPQRLLAEESPVQPTPASPSAAGASAVREYERRKSKRETETRARHPRIGGLILALSEEPQSTKAWAIGADGERRLGAGLDKLASGGVVAIHDRRIAGTRANIDHIAVGPTGVWVIDAKRYSGQVAKRDRGGWFSTDFRLYVGTRDCTKLVAAMGKQVAAVRVALGPEWADVPIRPALCFIDADWAWFARPFEVAGVLVAWPKAIYEQLVRPGPYTPEGITTLATVLEENLKPAS